MTNQPDSLRPELRPILGNVLSRVIEPDPGLVVVLNLASPALDQRLSFSRASASCYEDGMGNLLTVPANVPCIRPDGIIIQNDATTNYVRNGDLTGAVAGSPGTRPANVFVSALQGISWQIMGTGEENGFKYADIRFSGTPTNTGQYIVIQLDSGNTYTPAVAGETWTSSLYTKLVAGDLTNISGVSIRMEGRDSGGATVESANSTVVIGSGSFNRCIATRTMSNASTAFMTSTFTMTVTIGIPIDFTIRIAALQQEKRAFATQYVPTTGSAAATRAADYLTAGNIINLLSGTMLVKFNEAGLYPSGSAVYTDPVSLRNSSSTDLIVPRRVPGQTYHNLYAKSSGAVVSDNGVGIGIAAGADIAIAASFGPSGYKAVANGGTVLTKAAAGPAAPYTNMTIGGSKFCGIIKSVNIYNTEKSAAQMQGMATP